jgi:hypothetical protein
MENHSSNDDQSGTSTRATGRDVASRYWWVAMLPVAVCLAATVIAIAVGMGF